MTGRPWTQETGGVNKDSATWRGLWSSLDAGKPLSVYILRSWHPISVEAFLLGSGPEVPSKAHVYRPLFRWQLSVFKVLEKLLIFTQMPFHLFENPDCKRPRVWVPFFLFRKTEQFLIN